MSNVILVLMIGLEPTTFWLQNRRSTNWSYISKFGGYNRDWTCDLSIIGRMLYLLSYVSVVLPTGLEPVTNSLSGCCSTNWAMRVSLVLSTRLELVFPDYQSEVLPLNYESILYLVDMAGIEPATSTLWELCSNQLSYISIIYFFKPKSPYQSLSDKGCSYRLAFYTSQPIEIVRLYLVNNCHRHNNRNLHVHNKYLFSFKCFCKCFFFLSPCVTKYNLLNKTCQCFF